MAGARALWRANGMKEEQFGKPIIAIVNSFTQFVPGHTHLHEIGQLVKAEIEKQGCFAAEFNTIAIDDGIAMGHDGMLYSLPSRDIIADSVEYMVNAHKADAMVCISNCDKITPGMLMASMRLNIPTVFVSGGPMEAGELDGRHLDLIDAMIESADTSVSDERIEQVERHACPGCGCCSGMFTANSMNCLNEAIGLALPGNGTIVATHKNRIQLFRDAAKQIVENAYKYYRDGDDSVLPRNIATRQAFLNAMSLDIAMGGSTNTVLHLLAVAQEAGADFHMEDIDMLSRKTPCLCKVAPNTHTYHVQDVNRAGGILGIMNELMKAGLVDGSTRRADGLTQLAAPGTKMKICAFLWTYYGYPNSNYEGKNVEVMRYRNGEIMARKEMEAGTMPDVDFVAGVPDSGLPHAIGYANQSHKPFARPFVKYTPTWPRSFTPANQEMRNLVAKMKQIPVPELIQGKKLLFVDDSIVRGTQLRETVDFLYESGAKEVHMRSACPPIMYGCKYLNFSRSNSEMELIARRTVQNLEGDEGQKHLDEYADGTTQRGKCMLKAICEEMGFDSLGYQSLDGLLEAIGLDKDKVCTYCWNGKE